MTDPIDLTISYSTKTDTKLFNIPKPYYRQIVAMRQVAAQTGYKLIPGIEWIGHGYNILGTYARPDQVLPASIYAFDPSLLVKMNIPLENTYYSTLPFVDAISCPGIDYYSICSNSVKKMQDQMGVKAGIQGSYSWFSGDVNLGRDSNQLKDSSYSFASSVLRVLKWKLQLRIDGIKQHLDANFKSQLGQIGASIPSSYKPGKTPFISDIALLDQFFGTFGAYFVTGIIVGGLASAKSTVDNYGYVDQNSFSVDASASLLSVIGCDINYKRSTTLSTYMSNAIIYRDVWGGDASLAVALCADKVPTGAYQKWVASVSKNPCMIDFVDALPNSNLPLAGIWLLSADSRVSSYIKDYFTMHYAPKYGIPIDENGSYRRNIPYTITVKTCDEDYAGTDATITIFLRGTRSIKSPDRVVTILGRKMTIPGTDLTSIQLPTSPSRFERGDTDTFHAPSDIPEIPDLGNITNVHVSHDNRGDNPGWKVEYIDIGYKNKTWRFGRNVWLATDEGGTSKDLSPSA